jgi:protein subunit release factor B
MAATRATPLRRAMIFVHNGNSLNSARRTFSRLVPRAQSAAVREFAADHDRFEEKFVSGGGRGGQKVNKSRNAVFLRDRVTGEHVKVHASRSREVNRVVARQRLFAKIDDAKYREALAAAEKLEQNHRDQGQDQDHTQAKDAVKHGKMGTKSVPKSYRAAAVDQIRRRKARARRRAREKHRPSHLHPDA